MHIQIISNSPFSIDTQIGRIFEVLATDTIDTDYFLIDVPWGADYENIEDGRYTAMSPSYDEDKHVDGDYGWIHKDHVIILSDVKNAEVAQHLLRRTIDE